MICLPRGSMVEHGVEDDQEFAHAGNRAFGQASGLHRSREYT